MVMTEPTSVETAHRPPVLYDWAQANDERLALEAFTARSVPNRDGWRGWWADGTVLPTSTGYWPNGPFGDTNYGLKADMITVPESGVVIPFDSDVLRCLRETPNKWKQTLGVYFNCQSNSIPIELHQLLNRDLSEVAGRLRVRVVPQGIDPGLSAVREPLPLGLEKRLEVVLDETPNGSNTATWPINRAYAERWGVDQGALMDVALHNTRDDQSVVGWEPGGEFAWVAQTGDDIDTGLTELNLLDPRRSVPEINENGAVVCAPTTAVALICPVDPVDTFKDRVSSMLQVNHNLHTEATTAQMPNGFALSPNAFWWQPEHELEPFAKVGLSEIGPKLSEYILYRRMTTKVGLGHYLPPSGSEVSGRLNRNYRKGSPPQVSRTDHYEIPASNSPQKLGEPTKKTWTRPIVKMRAPDELLEYVNGAEKKTVEKGEKQVTAEPPPVVSDIGYGF